MILVSGNTDIRGGSSWLGRQMTMGLSTTAIFGDLDSYIRNVTAEITPTV